MKPHLPPEPITAARSTEANVTLSGSARCGPEVLSSTTLDYMDEEIRKIERYTAQELNTKQAERGENIFCLCLQKLKKEQNLMNTGEQETLFYFLLSVSTEGY